MKTQTILIILIVFLIFPNVSAGLFSSGDLTFSLNQKEYYFKVGENAIIPLQIENTYGKTIQGMLTYTYTQMINQGGMSFSSSNTQSTSFSVQDGKSTSSLNFGTSNSPLTLDVSLKFTYDEGGQRVVNLDGIKIHFVSDSSQKKNQQNRISSSSQKYSAPKQQPQQDPFAQMQKQLNQMFGNNQQQSQNSRLQNNQLQQDSSALKKELERQKQRQQEMRKNFQNQIFKNKDFQRIHQELSKKGYNLTSGNINPSSNKSGSFEFHYKKPNGDDAVVRGKMENGQMKSIKKFTQEDKNKILRKLKQNPLFQKYDNQLRKNGFKQGNPDFDFEENRTRVKINYKNQQNKTSTISADVVNGTIKNVKVQKPEEESSAHTIWWIIFLLSLAVLIYLIYMKYYKKKPKKIIESFSEKPKEKPFNYRAEAKKLLNKAKKLFEEGKEKDAYEKAGQAIRIYLSYKNGLKKETTNDEILRFLRNKGERTEKIKECFDLCSLVEFARYKANKRDFEKILSLAEKIIV